MFGSEIIKVTGIESVIADFFGSDVDIDTLEQW